MKTPEQLPLNFSAPPLDRADSGEPDSAQIVSLDVARAAKHDQRMGAVYAAIRESVRHIDLRRAARDRDSSDSTCR